jgi:hypothetical protein
MPGRGWLGGWVVVLLLLVAVSAWQPRGARAQVDPSTAVVHGYLTNVETTVPPLSRLLSFELEADDGTRWTFIAEADPGITGDHAREHMALREAVSVTYERRGSFLVALRVDD